MLRPLRPISTPGCDASNIAGSLQRPGIRCQQRMLSASGPRNALVWKFAQFAAVACSILLSGCTVCQNFKRTMKYEPDAFSWKHDRERSTEVYEQWAERVWGEESATCPEMASEKDYYLGFRDGFVDFIWAGGSGEPPPVPPRHLWNVMLRSPDGKRRADLWFDGYRHGARVARLGGYREMGTIRTSLVGLEHHPNGMEYPVEAMGPHIPIPIEPVPQDQVLPAPPAAQVSPSVIIPEIAPEISPTRVVSPVQLDEPIREVTSPAPIMRPVNKQPAAFEALGLALLPTEQPVTKSARTLETRDGSRPAVRNIKPTNSSPARYRRNPRQTNTAAPPEPKKSDATPSSTSIPSTRNSARVSTAQVANQPIRDIVLDRSRGTEKVVAAAHSEPIATKLMLPATHAADTADFNSSSPSPPAAASALEPAVRPGLQAAADQVIAAIHTEPITKIVEESTLHLKVNSAGPLPSQQPHAPVKFLNTITEPAGKTSDKLHRAADASSPPKVTISTGEGEKVERIVISGPLPTNTPAKTAAQSNTIHGTIRIRTTSDEVERLPVKAIGSTD